MFVKALEDMATGSLDWAKEKALKAAAELLAAKPEAEARLLAVIVNKLGDPSRRVASNAGYNISQLLTQHPLMGMVVVREVETFLFRYECDTLLVMLIWAAGPCHLGCHLDHLLPNKCLLYQQLSPIHSVK